MVLKDDKTESETYQFSFTELNFALCLGRDLDPITKKSKNDYYIVKSLRDGDIFARGLFQYECNYIFSKKNDEKLYNNITYSDGKTTINSLPDKAKNKLSFELKK